MSPLRTLRTIRYLRARQLVGQVQFRLRKLFGRRAPDPRKPAPPFPGCRWQLKAPWLAPGAQLNRADDLLAGRFNFLNRAESLAYPPRWDARDLPKLWQYNLHYFEYLFALDFASARMLVEDWMQRDAPVGWEPYPTSLRLQNWCGYFFGEHREETERDEDFAQRLWQSIFHQSNWLNRRLEFHLLGNHLLENATALLVVGCCFAGEQADRWRAKGLAILQRELAEQFLPDGGHFERSPMYHARATYLLSMLFNCGDEQVRALVRNPLLKAIEAAELMCLCDGQFALLNDCAWNIANAAEKLRQLTEQMELTISPRSGAELALPQSGFFGWFSNGSGVICDAAPLGPDYLLGHAHGDIFSCEILLHHHRVIVDSGVFDYEPGAMRRYCRSTAAHNTLEIDSRDQAEFWKVFRVARRGKPRDVRWEPFENGFRLSGWHDGYAHLRGKPVHHRLMRWHQPGILMIRDTVKSRAKHAIISRLHLHPQCAIEQRDPASLTIAYPAGQFKVFTTSAGVVEVEDSWFCPEFGVKIANKAIALRTSGSDVEIGLCVCDGNVDGQLDLRKGLVSDVGDFGW